MIKNELINMILSLGTWIHFHDVNLSILSTLCQQMKITEIIHIIFSLIVHQTTYQGPRVSVDVSGNLILCCEPQICFLALRAASNIVGEPRVDRSWKKGCPSGCAFGGLRLV